MTSDDTLIRTILILIAAVVLLPLLAMVVMMPMMGLWSGGHMWDGGAWNGAGPTWMWFLVSLLPILVLLGIVYLLYSAVRRPSTPEQDPALDELRAAYARGELSDEEFEKRHERLRKDR